MRRHGTTYGATPEQQLDQEVRRLRARVQELEAVARSVQARLGPYTAIEGFSNSIYAPGIRGSLQDLADAGIGLADL